MACNPLPPTVGGFIEEMSCLAELGHALDFTIEYVYYKLDQVKKESIPEKEKI